MCSGLEGGEVPALGWVETLSALPPALGRENRRGFFYLLCQCAITTLLLTIPFSVSTLIT